MRFSSRGRGLPRGLDEDGRAPGGTFGARIQLGVLIGIITQKDASILRIIKNIRNQFAHRVVVDFQSKNVMKLLKALLAQFTEDTEHLFPKGSQSDIRANLTSLKNAWEGASAKPEWNSGRGHRWGVQLLHTVFAVYQAYFNRLHKTITRIGNNALA